MLIIRPFFLTVVSISYSCILINTCLSLYMTWNETARVERTISWFASKLKIRLKIDLTFEIYRPLIRSRYWYWRFDVTSNKVSDAPQETMRLLAFVTVYCVRVPSFYRSGLACSWCFSSTAKFRGSPSIIQTRAKCRASPMTSPEKDTEGLKELTF